MGNADHTVVAERQAGREQESGDGECGSYGGGSREEFVKDAMPFEIN